MRRRIFNILCAASLMLFLATLGLWVRSYYTQERLRFYRWPVFSPNGSEKSGWGVGIVSNWGAMRAVWLWRRLPADSEGTLDGTDEPPGWFYNQTEVASGYPRNPSRWQRL